MTNLIGARIKALRSDDASLNATCCEPSSLSDSANSIIQKIRPFGKMNGNAVADSNGGRQHLAESSTPQNGKNDSADSVGARSAIAVDRRRPADVLQCLAAASKGFTS